MSEKRKVPCEVYSRVVGYLRPLQNWHKGKVQEFKERETYNVGKAMEHVGANRVCSDCGKSSDAGG